MNSGLQLLDTNLFTGDALTANRIGLPGNLPDQVLAEVFMGLLKDLSDPKTDVPNDLVMNPGLFDDSDSNKDTAPVLLYPGEFPPVAEVQENPQMPHDQDKKVPFSLKAVFGEFAVGREQLTVQSPQEKDAGAAIVDIMGKPGQITIRPDQSDEFYRIPESVNSDLNRVVEDRNKMTFSFPKQSSDRQEVTPSSIHSGNRGLYDSVPARSNGVSFLTNVYPEQPANVPYGVMCFGRIASGLNLSEVSVIDGWKDRISIEEELIANRPSRNNIHSTKSSGPDFVPNHAVRIENDSANLRIMDAVRPMDHQEEKALQKKEEIPVNGRGPLTDSGSSLYSDTAVKDDGAEGHDVRRSSIQSRGDIFELHPDKSGLQETGTSSLVDSRTLEITDKGSKTESVKFMITREAKENAPPNGRVIMIRMEPEHLGTIRLTLSSHDGAVMGRMVVNNSGALSVIEANIDNLFHELSDKGIKLDAFQVSIGGSNVGRKFSDGRPPVLPGNRFGWKRGPGRLEKAVGGAAMEPSGNLYINAGGVNWLA